MFSYSLDKYTEVELLDNMVVLVLIFLGIPILFSILAAPFYIPTNGVCGSCINLLPPRFQCFPDQSYQPHLAFFICNLYYFLLILMSCRSYYTVRPCREKILGLVFNQGLCLSALPVFCHLTPAVTPCLHSY